VVQKLLRKARKGSRVIYVPGNHDEFLRDYYGTHFGGIEIVETAIHVDPDGRRYLVIHGDYFDMIVKHAHWLALLGRRTRPRRSLVRRDHAYRAALVANTAFNAVRRRLG
jgi:UDP-2,3-diacylglucosamine pyrophosphatase LpxH